MGKRIISADLDELTNEKDTETKLRPLTFEEYVGQEKIKQNLIIFIKAALNRGESLDHVLLYGPPGLGKTTLAGIIANEMGANLRITSGPAIEKPGDVASILANLKENDVLFIDEIHRLNKTAEEVLYSAMEDYAIDVMIGKGPNAKSVRIDLPKFTLIGATTRAGLLSAPFRDRFGIVHKLEFYDEEELKKIIVRSSKILNVEIKDDGLSEIARRSRGTPRIANRLLKRVRDFADVKYNGIVDKTVACDALDSLEIDKVGLDDADRKYLMCIIDKYAGGPVGVDAIATSIGEDAQTVEEVFEPYLIKLGYISRTVRGRVVTKEAYKHLNLEM